MKNLRPGMVDGHRAGGLSIHGAADAELLRNEVHFQSQHRFDKLPVGAIHADLFRDNVLFDGERVGGLIDFTLPATICVAVRRCHHRQRLVRAKTMATSTSAGPCCRPTTQCVRSAMWKPMPGGDAMPPH